MSRIFMTVVVLAAASASTFAQLDPLLPRYNLANAHTYMLSPAGMNWQAAQAYSRSLGGHLVAINDASEQIFVQTAFGGPQTPPYWIGLSDHEIEGVWKWDSGEPVLYANFCASEPNNFGGVEDFAEILPAYTGGMPCWHDPKSPYTGTGISPTRAIIELPHGVRVDFDSDPISDCLTSPFPIPLGSTAHPDGISWNGTSPSLVAPGVDDIDEDGFPVTGARYLRLP